jgi:SNF2 family DNA or RNA helicase
LDRGESLGSSIPEFLRRFGVQRRPHKERIINKENLQKLTRAIESFSIRRLKEDVLCLPEKRYATIKVDLGPLQRKMYDRLREELKLTLINLDGTAVEDNAQNILKRLLRLIQVSSNPRLIDNAYTETPAKVKIMQDMVNEIFNSGEKVVIWTSFIGNIRILRRMFETQGAAMLFGEIPISQRDAIVRKFQERKDINVLVANPAAAKEGLTLTAANHAIYMDRTFNLVDYLQSQDRIHRISQERPVNIHNLVGKDTIDEYIEDIVYRKQIVAQFLYGDTDELRLPPPLFSKDELLRLLVG